MEINIDDNKIFVDRFDNESNKVFDERIDFIKKVYQNTKNSKEAINLSKIWVNYKYNGCRYQPSVFQKIKKYL